MDGITIYDRIGIAAQHIGEPAFHARLLDVAAALVPADRRQIVHYAPYEAPQMWASTGIPDELIALYLRGHYRNDPFFAHWCTDRTPGVVTLDEAMSGAARDGPYTRLFMAHAGYVDEVAVMLPWLGRATVALFLERVTDPFSKGDIRHLRELYATLEGLNAAHVRQLVHGFDDMAAAKLGLSETSAVLVAAPDGETVYANALWRAALERTPELADAASTLLRTGETVSTVISANARLNAVPMDEGGMPGLTGTLLVVESLGSHGEGPHSELDDPALFEKVLGQRLTRREADIVRLALAGYPPSEIARQLGLSPGTVRNYRHRLYAKLDITTERELMSLFLKHSPRQERK